MSFTSFIQKSIYVTFLYAFLFALPVTIAGHDTNGFLFLRAIALLYIFFNSTSFLRFCKQFKREITILLVAALYSFFRGAFSGQISMGVEDVSAVLSLVIIPFFLINYGKSIGIDSVDKLIQLLAIATALAVASSLAAFFVPSINEFFRDHFLQLDEDSYIVLNDYRGFGLGAGLTSHYSYTIGLICVLGILYDKYSKWMKFLIPFALVAMFINARTGVIITLVGVLIYLLKSGSFFTSIVLASICVIAYVYIEPLLSIVLGVDERTLEWAMGFVNDTGSYVQGDTSSGALNLLLHEMIHFPSDFGGWIFGEGVSLFHGYMFQGCFINSDIGFINQLFYGGIFFCVLLYSLIYYMIRRLMKMNQKSLTLFFFLVFLIVNFKSSLFMRSYTLGAMFLVYFSIVSLGSEEANKKRSDARTKQTFHDYSIKQTI